jgi:hypothetical protein
MISAIFDDVPDLFKSLQNLLNSPKYLNIWWRVVEENN